MGKSFYRRLCQVAFEIIKAQRMKQGCTFASG